MAKQIIIFIVSVLLLIVGGIWEVNYLNDTAKYLKTDIEYARYEIEKEDFDAASAQIDEIRKTWKSMSDVWNIFVNHDRIDDLEEALESLNADVVLKDKNSAIKSSMILKSIVSQIVDKQSFSFEHII